MVEVMVMSVLGVWDLVRYLVGFGLQYGRNLWLWVGGK